MTPAPPQFSVMALPGLPLVQPGDDLARLIQAAFDGAGERLQTGDVLVVTSKIVSKSEGQFVRLADVTPTPEAYHYADITGKDPRMVQLILQESRGVSRAARGVMVVEHRLGFVSANAGIDQSNIADGDAAALLMPRNPDQTAADLRAAFREVYGAEIGVVISDSHGRPFRMGTVGVAVGVAGLPALLDLRGEPDLYGRSLQITMQGYADMVASVAQLASGEGADGYPVVRVRGLNVPPVDGRAADLYRPPEQDLYR